jgi:hypothetical protein
VDLGAAETPAAEPALREPSHEAPAPEATAAEPEEPLKAEASTEAALDAVPEEAAAV